MDLDLRQISGWQRILLVAAGSVAAGAAIGWLLVTRGAVMACAALVVVVAGIGVLRSAWVSVAGVLLVAIFLPYATLPVGTSVTPTLLEVALLALIAVVSAIVLLDRRQHIRLGGPQALALGTVGIIVSAFLLGLGRGYTTQTLHDFVKFFLAIATFWLTIQMVTNTRAARGVIRLVVLGASGAASIGLALYAAGPAFTERALIRLVPYGYPGGRIARYIEDDPSRPMRAVGTAVDPNSFGGLLMIGFVLSAGQFVVNHRSMPRLLAGASTAVCGLALLLTYSRGAWVGAATGVTIVLLLRKPRLLIPLGGLGAMFVALGFGAGFVQRLWLGFTLQDPATKLRIDEYRNAMAIIREHPWFGVGFGDAPSIELQAGVSSIYLTIAERAGLIGLTVFLITVGAIVWRGLATAWKAAGTEDDDLILCFTAAFSAALVVGLVDHYFFNPQFPHMAALFWTLAAMIVAMTASRGYERVRQGVSSGEIIGRLIDTRSNTSDLVRNEGG